MKAGPSPEDRSPNNRPTGNGFRESAGKGAADWTCDGGGRRVRRRGRTVRPHTRYTPLGALIVLLGAIGLFVASPGAGGKPLIVAMDDNYPPYVFRDEGGRLVGVLIDDWALWSKKAGRPVDVRALDWGKALDLMRQGGADVLDTAFFNEERAQWLEFGKPYADIDVPIIVHKDLSGLAAPKSLKGFTVGVKAGDSCIPMLKAKGVTTLREYDSYEAVIRAAMSRELHVFCVDKPSALYFLHKLGAAKDFRLSFTLYTGRLHRAVKRGNRELLAEIESGFDKFSQSERETINERWLGRPLPDASYGRYILFVLVGLTVVGAGLFGVNMVLRDRVRRQTARLNELLDEVRGSEERFRSAMDAVNDGLWDWDVSTGEVYFSPGYWRMLGHDPDQAPTGPTAWLDRLHPDDKDRTLAVNMACVENRIPDFTVEFRIQAADGSWRWILGRGKATTRDASGRALRMVGTHVDVTTRKEAEAALLAEETRCRSVIENIADVFYATNGQGLLDMLSPSGARLLGYDSVDEMLGRPNEFFWLHPEQRTEFLKRLVEHGELRDYEVELKTRDGKGVLVATSSRIKRGPTGEFLGVEGIFRDITERKRAEERLVEMNRDLERLVLERTRGLEEKTLALEALNEKLVKLDELKSTMLSTVSHELRTPLTAIYGFVKLIRRDFLRHIKPLCQTDAALSDRCQRMGQNLDVIEEEGRRLGRLINDLLDLTRIESGRMQWRDEPTPPNRLIERAVAVVGPKLESKPGLWLTIEPTNGLPWLVVDEDRLVQVLVNLVDNAVKYSDSGEIRVVAALSANGLRFSVRDSGPGVSPEESDRVFEQFYQIASRIGPDGATQGAGLGLAICKEIVEHYGGRIWVDPAANPGGEFLFEIPAHRLVPPRAA